MLTIENDLTNFFLFIGNEEKQKRFNSLVKEKNLSLEDLDVIFQTIKPHHSGIECDISRVCSVKTEEVIVVEINKGKGTKESQIHSSHLWWTKEGKYIGETTPYSYGFPAIQKHA